MSADNVLPGTQCPATGERPLELETRGTPGLFGMVVVAPRDSVGWPAPPFGTFYFQTARYRVVLAGTTPLRGAFTIPDSWFPGTGWTAQAIVREPAPATGNTSNAYAFKIE